MSWLEKSRQLISKRDKEGRSNYFCSKLFLVNITFTVQYFEQFTNNEFLDWHYERLCFTSFQDVPILCPLNYPSNLRFSDVFREYKRGTLGRNRLSFLSHFSPVLLFYNPCKYQKTLGFLVLSGGLKWKHWEEMAQIISYLC